MASISDTHVHYHSLDKETVAMIKDCQVNTYLAYRRQEVVIKMLNELLKVVVKLTKKRNGKKE